MARLLESYDRLQSMPFGEWTRRNSDPGLRNMNSQRSILTSALRTGLRNARKRGDAAEVMANLNAANAYGVEATGVGSYEARQAGAGAFEQQTRKQTAMNEQLANRAAAAAAGTNELDTTSSTAPGSVMPTSEAVQAKAAAEATPGNRFVSRATEPRLSFAEQEAAARQQSAASGAFGRQAQTSAQNLSGRQALAADMESGMVDRLITLDEDENWRKRAKTLGIPEILYERTKDRISNRTRQ